MCEELSTIYVILRNSAGCTTSKEPVAEGKVPWSEVTSNVIHKPDEIVTVPGA